MRRIVIAVVVAALGAGAAGGLWFAKRTVRWNDARTMPPPLEAAVRAYGKGDDAAGLEAVRTLLRRYRAPAWEPRARVLAATRLARAGREREIVAILPKELAPADPLATYGQLLLARGLLAQGHPDRAAELATRAADAGGSPDAEDARIVLAAAQDARGSWRDALRTLDAAPSTATAVAAARIAIAHGDREGARRRLIAAALTAPGSDAVDSLVQAFDAMLPDVSKRFGPSERAQLAVSASRLLEGGRAQSAVDLLDLARPASALATATPAEALVEAQALLKLGRVDDARAAALRARQGDATAKDGASYINARVAAAQGRFGAYRAGLEALGRRGLPPWRERALLDLAKTVEGVPSQATLDAYRRYRLAAGGSADPLALLREGWAAYEVGRNAEADAGFARALARPDAPDGVRATAMYWRARLAERAGRGPVATAGYRAVAETFGNHYYGMLAAKRLGLPAASAGADVASLDDPARLGDAGRWLSAGRLLVSVGLWDVAAPYYRVAVRGAGPRAATVALEAALVAQDAAALSDAIAFAQLAAGDRDRTRAGDLPRALWRLLYPAPPAEAIVRAARENGLDPNLVASVALQESAFNPIAVSAAGARGLLQVMPAVGAELAAALRIPRFTADDLFDPTTNLRLGSAHLRDYRRRFDSLPRALAAYNGGPARVERWAAGAAVDDERFVERIPIPETRLYVKRVLAGARMYGIAWPGGLGVD
jgi:soluble lytic murein transglycosylase-like protein